MTAETIELVACIDCNGAGDMATSRREPDTGVTITIPCPSCDDGTVDACTVSECESCTGSFWTGDGCEHRGTRCGECKTSCADCSLERQADLEYDPWREMQLIGGAA